MIFSKKNIAVVMLCLIVSQAFSQVDYETIQVKSNYSGGWSTQRAKLVSLIPGYNSVTDGSDDFTRYGTYKYFRTDSTGFFYVKKIDGRWWMIDPDGYAGINMAVNSLSSSNIQNDYDILRRNGFNGTGNFLASESQTKSGYNLQNYTTFSYTRRLNFFLTYKNVRKNYYTTPAAVQGSSDHIFVLDPQFAIYCDNLARTNVTPFVAERDLLGWFTDNEINFNQDQLRNLVKDLPEGDPSRNAALAFATSKGLTESDCINYTSKVTEAIKQEFAVLLAEHYFKTVSEAIRKYDTNHMILGSRFHGRPRAIQGVVDASHKYMDVTSVNFYDRWSPSEQIAKDSWTNDKPCLVTEFYIKDINQSTGPQSGAGWYVNSQADRGKFYQNTCLELLKNKCFVGWHYFRFEDDPDGSNKGMVNSAKVEYTDMTRYMEELNKQVYRLCDYYDGINRRPISDTIVKIINVIEDTYVIPGSSNTDNFGTNQELEVRYNTTEANRREAYLKFDLSSVKSLLPYLKNAELEVTCTQTDNSVRALFVGGLLDKRWSELTLNGQLRNSNPDWKNGYNRLAFQKGILNLGKLNFEVTNWIYDQPDSIIASFKIFDLNSLTTSLKIASKENPEVDSRPKLKLTFWDYSTTVITTSTNNHYQVFPNPVQNTLRVDGNIRQMELLGINGQFFCKTNTNSLNISSLKRGIYLLKILPQDNDEFVYRKVIRE